MDGYINLRPVEPADMAVKDRSVMPPDRPAFVYLVKNPDGGDPLKVLGNWSEYLADLAANRIYTPPPVVDSPDRMQIQDLYGGIPDTVFIPDPLSTG